MVSAPAFHFLFFFLSGLFGLNVPMTGQEAIVHIDKTHKTGSVTYQYVATSPEKAEQAKEALTKLSAAETFDRKIDFMQLTNKTITADEDNFQVEVHFSYEEEAALLKGFDFTKDDKGNISLKLLERESLISTNGRREKNTISWKKDSKEIQIRLSARVLDEHEKGVGLSEYWEGE